MLTQCPKVRFEGEWAGENVLFLLRAHPITNVLWILAAIFAAFLPLFFYFSLKFFPGFEFKVSFGVYFLLVSIWLLIVFIIAFQRFLYWFFNIYILTNKRVVDFDFYSVFSHKVAQAALSKIQDVTFEKKGIFANLFDYGNIKIQTAAEVPQFVFERIPDPEGCSKQILELISSHRRDGLGG